MKANRCIRGGASPLEIRPSHALGFYNHPVWYRINVADPFQQTKSLTRTVRTTANIATSNIYITGKELL